MRRIPSLAACALALACNAIVATPTPTTTTPWTPINTPHIDKVDLLFMIDNSSSMGDKQDLLAEAIPDLVARLITPNCVDALDPTKPPVQRVNGACPDGTREEFEAVHDMHIGVVTSSLGGGGGDVCPADSKLDPSVAPTLTKLSKHNDDRGHLIDRARPDPANPPASGVEDPIADAGGGDFLAWLPSSNAKNAGKAPPPKGVAGLGDPNRLTADFKALVQGAGEFGCDLEAQMESWYRFLVQPDPYDRIVLGPDPGSGPPVASLVGVDATLLAQRADFLRPDSLLAVIVVTDEEDSWSDPMWLGGRGWLTRSMNDTFSTTGLFKRETSACDAPMDPNNPLKTGPNDPSCSSCAFNGTSSDPNCQANNGMYGPKEDGLNVRYTNDMKRRYGLDPQFPIQRYVDGLRSALVPNRQGEHYTTDDPNAKATSSYLGRKNCTNPIYAASLPTDPNADLCHLKRGSRTSDLVFFSVIGGVPWQLLTENPADPYSPFKTALTDSDWVKLLGKDPATYQQDGIDPHMIESIKPRAALAAKCPLGSPATCDAYNGAEWDTLTSKIGIDLQYACTFALPKPKDCATLPDGASCDCGGPNGYAGPLCEPNPNDGGRRTLQTRGKAYPTIRELRVAQKMGDNGTVASLCPRTLDPKSPDYGYRPAMRGIVSRLEVALMTQCLSSPMARAADGTVSCQVFVIRSGGQATACDPSEGLAQPDPGDLASFNTQRLADATSPIKESDLPPACLLVQLTPGDPPPKGFGPESTCERSGTPGWCYVEGAAAGQCPLGQGQAIKFGVPPSGPTAIRCTPPPLTPSRW